MAENLDRSTKCSRPDQAHVEGWIVIAVLIFPEVKVIKKGVTWKVARLGALAFLLSIAGCFSYMPVELETVPQGRHVRVEMTRLGFAALPEIPRQSGPRLAGRIAGTDEEQLLLSVPMVLLDGSEVGREVVIPTRDILQVEIRELNRTRTGIAIASAFATSLMFYMSLDKGRPIIGEEVEEQETEGDPGDPGASPGRSVFFSVGIRIMGTARP